MKFFVAMWHEFLKNIRDIKMIGIMLLFPVVTIYLISSAVAGFFEPGEKTVINAAYVNLDEGAIGAAFDSFIDSDAIGNSMAVYGYGELDAARQVVDDKSRDVLIYLPADISSRSMSGEDAKIEVYGPKADFAKVLVSGFTSSYNANLAVIVSGGTPVQLQRSFTLRNLAGELDGGYPDLTNYYAVLMLLQVLVLGIFFGAYITARGQDSDMHIRIHTLPVSRWTLLYGRIAGSVAYLLLVSAGVILFTKYAYGVDWEGNLPVIIGTLALFCFTMVGLGVISGKLFRKVSTSLMIAVVLMFFFGMVSGSTSPRSGMTALAFISPNHYAKVLLFGSIYGYPADIMLKSAVWLCAIAAAVYTCVTLLMRRSNYDNI